MMISSSNNRRALTLIEMLIGMAITLVMMAAVVNLFANISQGVRNRRATMEVSANLRIARTQLFNDLAGATCLKYPKNAHGVMPKPDSNNPPDGYFEYVEGEYSDDNPSPLLDGSTGNGELDYGTSLVPSGGDPSIVVPSSSSRFVATGDVTNGGGLGDYDDILAMTVENEVEKFRGKGRGLKPGGDPRNIGTAANNFNDGDWIDMAISSPVAEVVWFAIENPTDRSEGEPGMRKVYRRTLLVAPWYGTETKTVVISGTPTAVTGSDPLLDVSALSYANQVLALRNFQEQYDISVRLENGRLVPNSLDDLARRENRFAHAPNDTISPVNYFPHQFPYNTNDPTEYIPPYPEPNPTLNVGSLRRFLDERQGEDLILTDVLAFDVQIYDPGAPLYSMPRDQGTIIQPSSSQAFFSAVVAGPNTASSAITGFGTYADLGWNNGNQYNYITNILPAIPTAPAPLFQQERRLGWHPAFPTYLRNIPDSVPVVYDTWTTYYESDQINQEEALLYTQTDTTLPWLPWQMNVIDQGTNGLDEDGFNGPDDPIERETSPPYPYPLLGVQVKLRVYEPESRQIRETTVTRNLAK